MQIQMFAAVSYLVGVVGLIFVAILFQRIRSIKVDNDKAAKIAKAIKKRSHDIFA